MREISVPLSGEDFSLKTFTDKPSILLTSIGGRLINRIIGLHSALYVNVCVLLGLKALLHVRLLGSVIMLQTQEAV